MIKKQKDARNPQVVVPEQADLAHVTGGDPNTAKIRETVVADVG